MPPRKTNRGNSKSVTDELLSHDMDTEFNMADQIRILTDTMKKMNNSIESLRSEVKDIHAELGQSVNFAHDNISDVKKQMEKIDKEVTDTKKEHQIISR